MTILRRSRLRAMLALLFTLTLVVALAGSSLAQLDQWGYWENGVTESWWFSSGDFTKEDAQNAVARWKDIESTKQGSSGNEWAGDYFRGGETHGTYFRWSPQSGFIMAHVDKCQARVMGLTYGKVRVFPTVVEFSAEFYKAAAKQHGHSHMRSQGSNVMRFVPIKWKGDRLLVAEDEMTDFGDYLAGLGRYNFSDFSYFYQTQFFAKNQGIDNDQSNALGQNASASERPLVPAAYQRFLKQPIVASVISVGVRQVRKRYSYQNADGTGESYFEPVSLTPVKISAGQKQGLRRGMFLRVVHPDEGDRIRIMHAGKLTSTGIIIRDLGVDGVESFFDSESETKPHSRIAPGWKLTTSPF